MTNKDLPALRQLAANGQIVYTYHGQLRMLERGYLIDDVTRILSSHTNQIVEIQPPSAVPGKEHKDERVLISDPMYHPDTAILISVDVSKPAAPTIVIVTVEEAKDEMWYKDREKTPWLIRKQ